jgi:hypothetical protein
MSFFHLSRSSNKKLGKGTFASTSSWDTCSISCGLFKECYAKKGPQSWHAAKVNRGERGTNNWDEFCAQVENIPKGSLFRHNVSGDLPYVEHYPGETWRLIDTVKLDKLQCATVNAGVTFYTYTHLHDDDKYWSANRGTILRFSQPNFVINVSTEDVTKAVNRFANGFDVVITNTNVFDLAVAAIKKNQATLDVVSSDNIERSVKVIPCPEQYTDSATCKTCKLCARANRNFIIAFKQH